MKRLSFLDIHGIEWSAEVDEEDLLPGKRSNFYTLGVFPGYGPDGPRVNYVWVDDYDGDDYKMPHYLISGERGGTYEYHCSAIRRKRKNTGS